MRSRPLPLVFCLTAVLAYLGAYVPGLPHGRADTNDPKSEAVPQAARLPQKTISTADLHLAVSDLKAAEDSLGKLITAHNGFIARSQVASRTGARGEGTWTVRVPRTQEAFVDKVEKLGTLERSSRESREVTEEFYDLQARIKSRKVAEDRLHERLEKSTGKESILPGEKEKSRVREDIEQLEARFKALGDLTEWTTVTIHCQEQTTQPADFEQTVASTFSESLQALVSFCMGIVLVVVALTPWLPVLLLIGVPVWLLARRASRLTPATTSKPPPS